MPADEREPGGLVAGKVALVTGGASGIGRAAALALARDGARVTVSDIDAKGGGATVDAIAHAGGEARFIEADVSDEADVEALVDGTVAAWGRVDCAFNNAGITGAMGLLHDVSLADWQRTLNTNLTSVFLCMKHELRAMRAQGAGVIVNTSSGAGIVASPTLGPYCATKHGILGLTKTAALENARSGVRINAICPGTIDTPMIRAFMASSPEAEKMIMGAQPSGRLGQPEEIAEAVVWLCSDRASLVSGDAMVVDGATVNR